MLPTFIVDETTIRLSGESSVVDTGETGNTDLLLTLGITHAVEQESLNVELFGSDDGLAWSAKPVLSFPQKFYCGTYQMLLPRNHFRYFKAIWRVNRWGRGDLRPYFGIYLFAQPAGVRILAGAA